MIFYGPEPIDRDPHLWPADLRAALEAEADE